MRSDFGSTSKQKVGLLLVLLLFCGMLITSGLVYGEACALESTSLLLLWALACISAWFKQLDALRIAMYGGAAAAVFGIFLPATVPSSLLAIALCGIMAHLTVQGARWLVLFWGQRHFTLGNSQSDKVQ